jgi:RNA polymerase sigma factor (TIGR02999 family)
VDGRKRRDTRSEMTRLDDDVLEWFRKQAHAGRGGNYQTLVNAALREYVDRRRGFAKRGGAAVRVPLDDVLLAAQERGIEVLALDEALGTLARIDGRKGRVVELRYFGGLSIEETAEVLGVSVDTVKRDWRMARAWLISELAGKQESTGS